MSATAIPSAVNARRGLDKLPCIAASLVSSPLDRVIVPEPLKAVNRRRPWSCERREERPGAPAGAFALEERVYAPAMDSALIGVLIGGFLALAGQLLVETL